MRLLDPRRLPGARKGKLPERVSPQLAELVAEPPAGEGWLHEMKFDGYRILAHRDRDSVRLRSRRGEDWTVRFDSVARAVTDLPVDQALLDGEVVLLDEHGIPDFQALQNVLSERRTEDLVYYVFDLLYLDGYDLSAVALVERKAALGRLLNARADRSQRIRLSDHVTGQGTEFFRQACAMGLEGIVSKRANDPYRPGRGPAWVKTKCRARQEFVIGGYTDPSGAREGFGALLVGVYDQGKQLQFCGKVGTGFTAKTIRELLPKLRALESSRPPFANPPRGSAARGVHWLKPKLVAEVEFAGWTKDAILRAPAFKGLRSDKPPEEIVREQPKPAPRRTEPASRRPVRGRPRRDGEIEIAGVRITHPDRVLYGPQGITKADVARYYVSVADRMLPHVAGRPLTLLRCPEGAEKECFYQRHAAAHLPASIRRVEIDEKKKTAVYPAIDTLEGLIALVQFGVLEIHPWGARSDDLEHPDRLFFDLDPGPDVEWKALVETARLLREQLSAAGLRAFVKTTGGKGLHVVSPIAPTKPWSEVTEIARAVAHDLAGRFPGRYVATSSKAVRGGKIFIDYLRNARSATAVAAYSTRARPGATVSAPLSWKELGKARPEAFSVQSMARRLRKPDPWQDFRA